jgi:rhamnosyltransferase
MKQLESSDAPKEPQRSNTCAIVVTFRPDAGLVTRVSQVMTHAREIVIVDDGSGAEFAATLEGARLTSSATLLCNRENRGQAAALNQATEFALSRGFEWALVLDQDSLVLPALLTGAQAAYREYPTPQKLAVIGADHDHAFHYKKRKRFPNAGAYRDMRTVITSGSFVCLAVLRQIGGFKEELFIDSVDDEYCMRARQHGFAIIEATAFGTEHKIGAPKTVQLFGKPRSTSNHSPVRRYYMARNRVSLAAKYFFRDPAWSLLLMKSLLREFLFIAMFEELKAAKFKASAIGIWDSIVGRSGKLNEARISTSSSER